jgi:ribose 5-phosphate isomerase A
VTDVDALKREAGLRVLESVRDGMVLGLGSGSTAEICVRELGRLVQDGLRVVGVPTSRKIETIARQVGVPIASLDEHERLDLTFDGADEIELATFNLIKGRGGSLLREKLVAVATDLEIIIADESKLVSTIGEQMPVPIEVVKFGWRRTADRVAELGTTPVLRERQGEPFVSDEGHFILDCHFGPIQDVTTLAARIKSLVGVVEHGLFLGLARRVIVAGASGVRVYEAGVGSRGAGVGE